MEDSEFRQFPSTNVLSRKSWVAYVVPLSVITTLLLIMTSFHLALGIIPMLMGTYTIMMLRSYKLYVDDNGVWVSNGIFPWDKGSYGVKWRDIDGASYRTGFTSWALKSFTVTISHRFTKANEIVLSHMQRGDKAVAVVNHLLEQRVSGQPQGGDWSSVDPQLPHVS